MAEVLSPPPVREALIERQPLTPTATWIRWLDELRRSLALLQADLATVTGDVAALAARVTALEAAVDALEAALAALVQPQTTTLTVAVSGAGVLTFPAMAPAGATVWGVTWRVSTTFTGGVTGLLVGDLVAADRWGVASAGTAGTTGASTGWRGQGGFTVASPYSVLAAPLGAGFGGAGALTCACTWWPALSPPA